MNFFKELSKNNICSYNPFKDKHTKYNTYLNNNKNRINTTLDNKHNEKISEFFNNDGILKKKKKKYLKLLEDLKQLNNILLEDINFEIINNKANIKNELDVLKDEINILTNRINELDYYENTIDILLEYYNKSENTINNEIISTNTINNIFKHNDIIDDKTDKSKLYNKYMKIVYNQNVNKIKKTHNIKICSKCKIEKTIHISDGYIICTQCGDSELILLENDKNYYKDSTNELKICSYKRVNHLSEILNQFQAKETTDFDPDIYDKIKTELNIQRIYNYKNLDFIIIKKILKKLKLNKFYEHTHHIINILNGLPPPTITREQEEYIKKIFKDIQKPFSIYRPKKRKNFLNYNYIIHKICELLEYDNFLPNFPLLKSRINLEEQDIVWEKICTYNNYEFIPSI